MAEHEPIVFGPVAEGERTIGGHRNVMPGYGWSCTCKQAGFGYVTEAEAEDFCQRHIDGRPSDG